MTEVYNVDKIYFVSKKLILENDQHNLVLFNEYLGK